MKQPTFNWEADNKYTKLKTSTLEVNNILSTFKYTTNRTVSNRKELVRKKGLQFLESLTN